MLSEGISWEISIVGLTLTIFTLATQSYRQRTNILLCIWLVILSIPLVHAMLEQTNIAAPLFRLFTNPGLNLLQGPLLYFYVSLLIREKEQSQSFHLLHLFPFVLFYALFILLPYAQPMHPKPGSGHLLVGIMEEKGGFRDLLNQLLFNFGIVNFLCFLAYSVLTISTLMKHQKKISLFFSQNDNQINLKWIYLLPASFVFLIFLIIINENVEPFSNLVSPSTLHLLSYLSFIILLSFFGIKQKPVFTSKESIKRARLNTGFSEPSPISVNNKVDIEVVEAEVIEEGLVTEERTEVINNKTDDVLHAEIIEKMQIYVTNEKPYLDPSFSVYELANALNVPRRNLSHILSHGLSMNFFQYVNEYRIKEVKRRLESPQDNHLTILDVAFDCGFKSKSSFNSLFKQHCQITPSQYRKMIKEEANS